MAPQRSGQSHYSHFAHEEGQVPNVVLDISEALDTGETKAIWWIQSLPKAEMKRETQLASPFSRPHRLIPRSVLEAATRAWYNVYSATSTVYSDGRNKQSGACLVRSPTPPSPHTTFLSERPSQGPVKGFYHWDWLLLKLSQLLPSVAVK